MILRKLVTGYFEKVTDNFLFTYCANPCCRNVETCETYFRYDPTTVKSQEILGSYDLPIGIYCQTCNNEQCIDCKEDYHAPASCNILKE